MKRPWEYRRDYNRAAGAFCKVNGEVGDCLEALHAAMKKRDAMQPRYERARKAVDRMLYRERTSRQR